MADVFDVRSDPGYDEDRAGSRLNAAEVSACLLTRRGGEMDEVEMKPLAVHLRVRICTLHACNCCTPRHLPWPMHTPCT